VRARPPEPASIRVMALVLQELGCWAGNSRISICVRFGTVRRRASNPISPSRVCCPPWRGHEPVPPLVRLTLPHFLDGSTL